MRLDINKLELIKCELREIFPDYFIFMSQTSDSFLEKDNHTIRLSLEFLIDLPVEQLIELVADLPTSQYKRKAYES